MFYQLIVTQVKIMNLEKSFVKNYNELLKSVLITFANTSPNLVNKIYETRKKRETNMKPESVFTFCHYCRGVVPYTSKPSEFQQINDNRDNNKSS